MRKAELLENEAIFIIREAYAHFKKIGLLWSIGKDSTTLLWLIRKAFFGKVPFPVIHIDTGYKFKEIYKFRDEYAKKWKLDLLVIKNDAALNKGIDPNNEKFNCCTELKTNALKKAVNRYNFEALYLAIRRDEHGIRAKERIFSPRNSSFEWDYKNQPLEIWSQYWTKMESKEHTRIHPLLGWREIDVWEYIKQEKIPVVSLYFAKNKKRYRSIGCEKCCNPVNSSADSVGRIINELKKSRVSERSGRAQDKESDYTMQKLRALGYM